MFARRTAVAPDWYEGPLFTPKTGSRSVRVNVVGSSWPIRGVPTAKPVRGVLKERRAQRSGGGHVLDFGAGSWLRYIEDIQKELPAADISAVEFDEAFRDEAAYVKAEHEETVSFWCPKRFVALPSKYKFDVILLVNVLNTLPEDEHQRSVFACLAKRLNPWGWLVVYQRVWAKREQSEEDGAIPYGNGWLVPQLRYGYYTYRGKTGANWFKAQAVEAGLVPIETHVAISSENTLLRVWERPLGD